MQPQTVTLIVGSLGIVSTLCAAFGGQFLTRSWQHRQWFLDGSKEEARELLSAIAEHHNALLRFYTRRPDYLETEERRSSQQHEIDEAQSKALRTIRDRIFLADYVKQHRLLHRWVDAFAQYEKDEYPGHFTKEYEDVRAIIVASVTGVKPKRVFTK